MKKKQTNRNFIIIAAVITAIVVIILFAVSMLQSGNKTDDKSKSKIANISDTIKHLVESSDLEVKYVNSAKRKVIFLIGSENYHGVMFNDGKIFIKEGVYTAKATTDAMKISEAEDQINNNSGFNPFADNVERFNVEGANIDGEFTSGTVQIEVRVKDSDGHTSKEDISAKISIKEPEE